MFDLPPMIFAAGARRANAPTTEPLRRRRHDDAVIAASAVTLIGILGFLGLLVAGNLFPGGAVVLRVIALIWFVIFGALYVKISAGIG